MLHVAVRWAIVHPCYAPALYGVAMDSIVLWCWQGHIDEVFEDQGAVSGNSMHQPRRPAYVRTWLLSILMLTGEEHGRIEGVDIISVN